MADESEVAYLCDTGEAIQGVEDVGRIMHHALNREFYRLYIALRGG